MKEIECIIKRYEEACQNEEALALGTVVKVEGSTYRRIGARLLVNNRGHWVGGISGGCLEGDALKRAKMAMFQNKNSIVIYDTTEDDPHQIGAGLGCNGRIEVLFTPIHIQDKNNHIEYLKRIVNKRKPSVLLQVLSTKNSSLQLCGRFLCRNDISSFAEEIQVPLAQLQEKEASVLHKRKSSVFELQNEDGEKYEILFEYIQPKIKLICIGDNYDVRAMVNVANELGWQIHLVGKTRKVSKSLLQKADFFTDVEQGDSFRIDQYTAIVLMSHDYKTDLKLLRSFIHLDVPYIGLLGPKKRMLKMDNEILGVDLEQKRNLYAPVGLDIGAESPEEIALSIASEIITVFRNRNGHFLKRRPGSIHEEV